MINNRLAEVFKEVLKLSNDEIENAEYLNTQEWDSLQHVSLILALEKEFNCQINSSEVTKLNSYRNILKYLLELKNNSIKPLINDTKPDIKNIKNVESYSSPKLYRGLSEVYFDKTLISFVDQENSDLYYRGYSISDLINSNLSFEAVLYLLIYGRLPNNSDLENLYQNLHKARFLNESHKIIIENLLHLPPKLVMQALIPIISLEIDSVVAFVVTIPSIIYHYNVLKNKLEYNPNILLLPSHAEFVLGCLNPARAYSPQEISIFEKQMILHMEHGANTSTFACRVSASTRSYMSDAILAAISTFAGPLHGGALEKVSIMIDDLAQNENNIEEVLEGQVRSGKPIYGFGHRVYKTNDPRSFILERLLKQSLKESFQTPKYIKVAERLIKVLSKYNKKGLGVNVDFFSALILRILGFNLQTFFPSFVCSRIVGWIAHYEEQTQNNVLIRPRLFYKGKKYRVNLQEEELP